MLTSGFFLTTVRQNDSSSLLRSTDSEALQVGGTRREHASMLDTLDFLVEIFEDDGRTALANALRRVVEGLRMIAV